MRSFYAAIDLLLRNLWVGLHPVASSTPRRGCRRYNWDRLRVERMLLWLEQRAARMFGLVLAVSIERDPPEWIVT